MRREERMKHPPRGYIFARKSTGTHARNSGETYHYNHEKILSYTRGVTRKT